MDFGDWIYIIVVMGISLLSLLKKGKKQTSVPPTASQRTDRQATNTSVDWDKIWGELKDIRGDIEEFQQEKVSAPPPPKPQKQTYKTQNRNSSRKINQTYKQSSYANKDNERVSIEPEHSEPVFSISDLDDMKKAVIYSEILNKKYN